MTGIACHRRGTNEDCLARFTRRTFPAPVPDLVLPLHRMAAAIIVFRDLQSAPPPALLFLRSSHSDSKSSASVQHLLVSTHNRLVLSWECKTETNTWPPLPGRYSLTQLGLRSVAGTRRSCLSSAARPGRATSWRCVVTDDTRLVHVGLLGDADVVPPSSSCYDGWDEKHKHTRSDNVVVAVAVITVTVFLRQMIRGNAIVHVVLVLLGHKKTQKKRGHWWRCVL